MKIMISGSSGLIGSALTRDLEAADHHVVRLSRDREQPLDFEGIDAVVHLAGENIASGRWTESRKAEIENSRVLGTEQLVRQLVASATPPAVFLCASATGFYGNRASEVLDETSSQGSGFLAEVCTRWEEAAAEAQQAGIRTVFLRTGIVLSPQGGALQKMLLPFKLGLGGRLGHGEQYMSWISLTDEVRAIRFLLEHASLKGAVNLVAPNPVTNSDFTSALAHILHRPAILPAPAFALRLLLGEMGDALLLASTRVLPRKLTETGFVFQHPRLDQALGDLLK